MVDIDKYIKAILKLIKELRDFFQKKLSELKTKNIKKAEELKEGYIKKIEEFLEGESQVAIAISSHINAYKDLAISKPATVVAKLSDLHTYAKNLSSDAQTQWLSEADKKLGEVFQHDLLNLIELIEEFKENLNTNPTNEGENKYRKKLLDHQIEGFLKTSLKVLETMVKKQETIFEIIAA